MKVYRSVACLLCVIFIFTLSSFTFATMRASFYIEDYQGDVFKNGLGTISVSCYVNGTASMDKIGVTTVVLEEQVTVTTWRTVKVYDYFLYPNMMINNSDSANVTLSYAGDNSKSYRATVTVYAEKNGGYDVRTFTVYS